MFSIGSLVWPGLSKVIEEAGEVLQLAGKLIATGGLRSHWNAPDLKLALEDEIGDLYAALDFFTHQNGMNLSRIGKRRAQKRRLFEYWHQEQRRKEEP